MSALSDRIVALRADWSQRARWLPHVPLWLMVAPLGLLLIDLAFRTALGISATSVEVSVLGRRRVEAVDLGALPDFAIGVLCLMMSFGLLRRSSLAWWVTVVGLTASLTIRFSMWREPTNAILTAYVAVVLLLLVVNRKSFDHNSLVTPVLLATFAILTLFAYHTLSVLQLGEHFEPPVHDVLTALYFVVVTVTSVGFGEIVPRDAAGRALTIWVIVSGLAVGVTAFSTAIVPLVMRRLGALLGTREKPVDRTNHFVIVGSSPLARNTIEELEKRDRSVTVILETASDEAFYKERDVVVGDPSDLSVLRAAGADKARGVLALSTDDAENGFVVLGVNELAPTVPSVAALNDPKNQFRLKRTQPSLLLSLQVLGGELLAKAMTGERVESDMLEKVLQLHTAADSDIPA
jgi:voltage-gated potassium channel